MNAKWFKNLLNLMMGSTLLATSLMASAFTEGTDYMVLEKPIPNAEKTLIKVFSYDCPFCYKYDKSVTGPVVEKVKGIVTFEPYHLETKGKYGKLASELFAILILKDQAAGVPLIDEKSLFKKAKFAYYNAYHDQKERWDSGADDFLKTGLDAVGMTKAQFDEAVKDPKVQAIYEQWKASYDVAKIQGVPAYVVNGKYLIYTKNIKSIDSLADLVKELAGK